MITGYNHNIDTDLLSGNNSSRVHSRGSYLNWFVVQVRTGKEYMIKKYLDDWKEEPVDILVFSRKIIFRKKGIHYKVQKPLFPGYIFINEKVEYILKLMQNRLRSEFMKPICFKSMESKCEKCFDIFSPCMVSPEEMEFILQITDNNGTIPLSSGLRAGRKIIMTEGPLKAMQSRIIWINKKKQKACVEFNLFNRKMQLTLGLDIFCTNDDSYG
jgi:transcriptional antiterminator NusG